VQVGSGDLQVYLAGSDGPRSDEVLGDARDGVCSTAGEGVSFDI
jgi:hypothetical protein